MGAEPDRRSRSDDERALVRARVFEEMLDAVLIADDDRRYVDANHAACRLFGLPRERLLGRRIDEFNDRPPAVDVDVDATWADFLLAGTLSGEFHLRRSDGASRVVEYVARANVVPGRHLSVLRDVTERVRQRDLAAGLAKERAWLAELLDGVEDAVMLWDQDWIYLYANSAAERLSGVPAGSLKGRRLWEVLPRIRGSAFAEMFQRVAATGRPERIEAFYEVLGRWIETSAVRTSVGVAVVARDVSARRQAQETTERSEREFRRVAELRERLIAIVSHDLRNPLGAIMTAAQLIERHVDAPPAIARLAARALSSGRRMARMIEQLLDYVRIEQSGGVELDRRPMDLGALAIRSIQESELAFPGQVFDLRIEGGELTGDWDGELTAQVVVNLLRNAVEHGEGGVSVVARGEADGAVLEVRNRGTIPADVLPGLFTAFSSGRPAPARRSGLGLGLYIAKQILDAHEGRLEVTSAGGQTCFTVRLPRRPGR